MKADKKSVIILISAAVIVFAATVMCIALDSPKYNDIGIMSTAAETFSVTETTSDTEAININTADIEELTELFGIGEKRAADIVEYREKNGKFRTVEELTNINGINKSVLEKNAGNITV